MLKIIIGNNKKFRNKTHKIRKTLLNFITNQNFFPEDVFDVC